MDVIASRTKNMLVFHFERELPSLLHPKALMKSYVAPYTHTSYKGYIFWPVPTCNYTEIRIFSKRRRFRMWQISLLSAICTLSPGIQPA